MEIIEYCRLHKKIYIYGAGRFGRETCVYLSEQGIAIDGFIVTSKELCVDSVLGIKVYSFDEIELESSDGVIAAVGKKYTDEVIRSLKMKGINDFFIIDGSLLEIIERMARFDCHYPSNQNVIVLLYHRVDDIEDDYWRLCVSTAHFEEQIKWISEKYPIIRFRDDFSKVSDPAFVITFDDGYLDNMEKALPILERYNVPATFFVSTGTLGNVFWWDRLYLGMKNEDRECIEESHAKLCKMNAAQIETFLSGFPQDGCARAMSVKQLEIFAEHTLVDIGAHTVSHLSLPALSEEEQRWEIEKSISALKKIVGKEIEAFSYPLGDYNAKTIEILKKLGIKKAATVSGGLAGTGDMHRIPRNVVRNWDIDGFKRFIERCFCVYAEVRR